LQYSKLSKDDLLMKYANWHWDEARAGLLVEDMKQYYHHNGPFIGGQADAMKWWENLADQHPIKALVITILAIVSLQLSPT
jgi:isochorismate hydrolase